MKTAMPNPTTTIITAMIIINSLLPDGGGRIVVVSVFVAIYAVNVGSCSTL